MQYVEPGEYVVRLDVIVPVNNILDAQKVAPQVLAIVKSLGYEVNLISTDRRCKACGRAYSMGA